MSPRSVLPLLAVSAAASLAVGCAAGTPASQLAQAPAYEPAGQTKCQIAASKSEPLIVEWPSAARGKLEAISKHGLVAVVYSGCEMEVLSACKVPGSYAYTAITRKHDHITVRDADDLYAKIPLGAASLEGTLQRTGQLDVSMTIVGRMESDRSDFSDLHGTDCDRATHVVSGLTLGAFDFSAGADAEVGGGAKLGNAGAGATSHSTRELIDSDGEEARCQGATAADARPPDGCGAIVRLEVTPIRRGGSQAKIAPPPPQPGSSGLEVSPRPLASPAGPRPAYGGPGETVRIEAADSGMTYTVSVEATDGMHACDSPVTEGHPCSVSGLGAGGARLHVAGDATETKDFTVSGEGTSTIRIVHHTRAAAWVFGALGVAGFVAGGVGLVQEIQQVNAISAGGTSASVAPDLLAGLGISVGLASAYALFVSLRTPSFTYTMDRLGTPAHDLAIGPSPMPGGGMLRASWTF